MPMKFYHFYVVMLYIKLNGPVTKREAVWVRMPITKFEVCKQQNKSVVWVMGGFCGWCPICWSLGPS